MFQSIKHLYISTMKVGHNCHYEINDTNFKTKSYILHLAPGTDTWCEAAESAAVIIKEYESRKYYHKEIVKNLFLLNVFLRNNGPFECMNEILNLQYLYLDTRYYYNVNFRNKYNQDLINYTKKMSTLL